MRILVISPRIPYSLTDGAWLCLYSILKRLSGKHDIYLLAFSEDTQDDEKLLNLKDIFKEIHTVKLDIRTRSTLRYLKNVLSWSSALSMKQQYPEVYTRFKEKMTSLIDSKNIDLIHCHLLQMAEFAHGHKKCIKVLHLIDSETLRMKRIISLQSTSERLCNFRTLIRYHRLKTFEKNAIKDFDANIVVGKKDFKILKDLSPHANITLIPNGVDTDYFHLLPEEVSEYPILIFFGKMTAPPNIDAAMYFYFNIFPLVKVKIPNIHFHIVGESPPDMIKELSKDKNVVVTGYVDDIRTYVAKADVVITPMRKGGGIKNKILEAMSLGRAVVSTSLGAEGIDVTNGENIIISDTPNEFAESIIRLLSNKMLRDKITKNARKLIDGNYTWDICARKYEESYMDLLTNR